MKSSSGSITCFPLESNVKLRMGIFKQVYPELGAVVRTCAMVILLAGVITGIPLKIKSVIHSDFSTQVGLDLDVNIVSKPLRSQTFNSITKNQRKGRPSQDDEAAVRGPRKIIPYRGHAVSNNSITSNKGNVFSNFERRAVNHDHEDQYHFVSVRGTVAHDCKVSQKEKHIVNHIHKRHIFPPDNRRRISNYQASNQFPYSATVKISTGCTGTLISNQHVLTAAHCVHNRTHFITATSSIRVGFLKSNGRFRWYRVVAVRFPRSEWMNSRGVSHDYAVLKLSKPHKRKYFRLAKANQSSVNIQFSSFPGDKKSNTMWYVGCSALVLKLSSSIMCKCDAAKGSSGAGIYTVARRRGKNKRVIIGVLSGATGLLPLPNGGFSYFNKAVSLRTADITKICIWAGSPRGCSS